MASFSVVSNIASANAQANLQSTPASASNKALTRAVERLPHQQLGRRRGRPRGRQQLPQRPGDSEPGHPQRQRRSVGPADQGRRAHQHLDAARPSGDAGDAGVLDQQRRGHHQAVERVRHAHHRNRPRSDGRRPDADRRRSRCSSAARRRRPTARSPARSARLARRTSASPTTSFTNVDDGADGADAGRRRAIDTLGDVQNTVGTLQNRLQFAISLATSQVVNTKAAESRIRDANIAEESANMTRFNILSQSGIAALAQANQSSSSVLSLLR